MAKILIGFMGSGKSSVASLVDPDFIDMDQVIADKIGMPIADFFEQHGEAAFRQLERQTLSDLSESHHLISTGGGVVLSPESRQLLASNGQTIYLQADFDTLYDRIQADKANIRPLFVHNDKDNFKAIFDSRQKLYQASANYTIDVTDKSPEAIAEIIKCL